MKSILLILIGIFSSSNYQLLFEHRVDNLNQAIIFNSSSILCSKGNSIQLFQKAGMLSSYQSDWPQIDEIALESNLRAWISNKDFGLISLNKDLVPFKRFTPSALAVEEISLFTIDQLGNIWVYDRIKQQLKSFSPLNSALLYSKQIGRQVALPLSLKSENEQVTLSNKMLDLEIDIRTYSIKVRQRQMTAPTSNADSTKLNAVTFSPQRGSNGFGKIQSYQKQDDHLLAVYENGFSFYKRLSK